MRLVSGARQEHAELSMHQAVLRIGSRFGVNADTLRGWCKRRHRRRETTRHDNRRRLEDQAPGGGDRRWKVRLRNIVAPGLRMGQHAASTARTAHGP